MCCKYKVNNICFVIMFNCSGPARPSVGSASIQRCVSWLTLTLHCFFEMDFCRALLGGQNMSVCYVVIIQDVECVH